MALKDFLKEDEELFSMDAVHPEFQSKAICGWIKSSEIKTLPTTSAQYRPRPTVVLPAAT